MPEGLVLLLWMAPVVVLFAVARNRGRQRTLRASTVELVVDELGVRRELADGRREAIDWDEVREVTVVHTRRGPHADAGGMLVLYGDETRGCIVPLDRAADSGVITRLSQLPGFDARRFSDALAATGTQEVWVHPEGGFDGVEGADRPSDP